MISSSTGPPDPAVAHIPGFASGCGLLRGVVLKPGNNSRSCGPSKGMEMANHISLRGFVSSEIEMSTTETGLVIGKFRMGSNMRRLDPITNQWVDGETNWFRVTAFRALASNAMISIHKGDRILVVGKLRVTSYLRKDGTPGTGVEIDADSIGPDLQFGVAHYNRMISARPAGQRNASNDAESSFAGGHLSAVPDAREIPADEPADLAGHDGEGETYDDDDMTEDDDQAAAKSDGGRYDEDGLEDGEQADLDTGEIVKEAAPF